MADTQLNNPSLKASVENGENFDAAFQGNILDQYDSSTYHFRLFMAPQELLIKGDGSIGTKEQQVTVAESGVTGVGIDEVTFTHVYGYSASVGGSSTALHFNITIKEPFDSRLYNDIYAASLTLGIENYHKCPYFLELTFIGNDRNTGVPVTIGDNKWVWPIIILSVKSEINAAGTTYVLECVYYNDLASSDQVSTLFSCTTINETDAYKIMANNTITNAFNALSEILTLNQSADISALQNQYEILLDPNCDFFVDDSLDMRPNDSNRHGNMVFSDGTTVEKMIDIIMSSSKKLQEMAKPAIDRLTNNADKAQKADIIMKKLYKIHTETQILEYDYRLGDYARLYRYVVTPYEMATVISSPDESILIPEISQFSFEYIKSKGRMKKHYNYLYTGQNTDIINFDLSFNFSWFVALPRNNGSQMAFAKIDAGKIKDITAQQEKTKQEYEDKIKYHQNNISAINDMKQREEIKVTSNETEKKEVADNISTYNQTILKETGLISDLTRDQNIANVTLEKQKSEEFYRDVQSSSQEFFSKVKTDKQTYVEDYIYVGENILKANANRVMPVSYRTDPVNEQSVSNTSGNQNIDDGRTFFSSLFAQANKNQSSDQLQGTFEIKGDPFWLGPPLKLSDTTYLTTQVKIKNECKPDEEKINEPWANLMLAEHFFLFTTYSPNRTALLEKNQSTMGKKSLMNGVYGALQTEHKFSRGSFTQSIQAVRHVMSDLQYVQLEKYVSGEISQVEVNNNILTEIADRNVANANAKVDRDNGVIAEYKQLSNLSKLNPEQQARFDYLLGEINAMEQNNGNIRPTQEPPMTPHDVKQ